MISVESKSVGASIPELSAEYGIGESTLYEMANRGALPGARRMGKRIVVHRQTFEDWVKAGTGARAEDASE